MLVALSLGPHRGFRVQAQTNVGDSIPHESYDNFELLSPCAAVMFALLFLFSCFGGGCCCWQHVRLQPRGVVRFLRRHVLKLEFWHFGHSTKKIEFCFRIGICGVFCKKKSRIWHTALSKNMLSSPFRIVFFGVFLCVAFRIGFCSVFADSRLSAHAGSCRLQLAFVFQLCAGVRGGMGGGGDNVHANAACVFCFLLLFPMCRISHRFLRCFCRLSTFCTCQLRLAFVFQLCAGVRGRGMGGGGDDVHANAASVFSFFCCVTSQTLPVAL